MKSILPLIILVSNSIVISLKYINKVSLIYLIIIIKLPTSNI